MMEVVMKSLLILVCVFVSEGFRVPAEVTNTRLLSSSLSRFSQYNLKFTEKKLSVVQNMKIDSGLDNFSPFLLRGEPNFGKQKASSKQPALQAGSFQWASCGPADQPINIRNLTLEPSPVYLPGKLSFGFDVEFRTSIPESTKLNGKLLLELQTGSSWLKIPCIGNIGSCSYADLCALSQQIPSCPPEFTAAGVPCKCPFQKGEYKLPMMAVEIDASVFLPGIYRAQVTLSTPSNSQLACYKATFTVG